jgi:hypothetical protein
MYGLSFAATGIGRLLAERVIREAAEIGYSRIRLDTVAGKMDSAIAMYRELGFKETDPYYQSPVEHTLFMELALTQRYGTELSSRSALRPGVEMVNIGFSPEQSCLHFSSPMVDRYLHTSSRIARPF